jgi:hypothetical protein
VEKGASSGTPIAHGVVDPWIPDLTIDKVTEENA